mmetsp:Transcript_26102/g.52739  ORF Transcript_26102/g.52739 Transcript_26102/m.52739 type:complete len:223 (+) Transcript_26102:437-1105(+)
MPPGGAHRQRGAGGLQPRRGLRGHGLLRRHGEDLGRAGRRAGPQPGGPLEGGGVDPLAPQGPRDPGGLHGRHGLDVVGPHGQAHADLRRPRAERHLRLLGPRRQAHLHGLGGPGCDRLEPARRDAAAARAAGPRERRHLHLRAPRGAHGRHRVRGRNCKGYPDGDRQGGCHPQRPLGFSGVCRVQQPQRRRFAPACHSQHGRQGVYLGRQDLRPAVCADRPL